MRVALVLLVASGAITPAARADAPSDAADRVLEQLVGDALVSRPELREAELRARAEKEGAAQAGALADPVLSLGIQNDGFDGIEIGTMETSFFSVVLSQELPWPGKRDLRRRAAELGASGVEAGIARLRLSTEADVRRAYLDLLLTRDRLALLEKLAQLWEESERFARARYEVAGAPQSDILRVQLERHRLIQRRYVLMAEEQLRVQALNRLRSRPVDEPIPTSRGVRDLPEPVLKPVAEDIRDAEARSPELRVSGFAIKQADTIQALARKDLLPDFSVTAGVMPRGGLEPMWQAGLSMNLPFLWGRARRQAAISQARLLADADRQASTAIAQTLRQRVAERRTALAAAKDILRLYRDGLLVQSNATVESTLTQYRVGRVTFASVLEAVAGYIGDEDAYLQTIADAQRIAIASAEVSVDTVSGPPAAGMGGGAIPGAGSAASRGMGPTPAGGQDAASPTSRAGGM